MLSPDIPRNRDSSASEGTTCPGNLSDYHVSFQDTTETEEKNIHPLFRMRPRSSRGGSVGPLDHLIASQGGTTSSLEELPHRLKISKIHQPMTTEERVIELTRINGYLLEELAYHIDTRAAEMKFWERVSKLRTEMDRILEIFDCALEARLQARSDAESILLNYWGINLHDGNLEDTVF